MDDEHFGPTEEQLDPAYIDAVSKELEQFGGRNRGAKSVPKSKRRKFDVC